MADIENDDKTINEEIEAADKKCKAAESLVNGYDERIKILKSKIEQSKFFLDESKKQSNEGKFEKASINAKESSKQAMKPFQIISPQLEILLFKPGYQPPSLIYRFWVRLFLNRFFYKARC